jgi:prepilin-type N-terminal cleavage/methylation domain-containing protein
MIPSHRRNGFTLIELMVVTGLIAVIATMIMAIAPGIMAKDRSVDAATTVQQVLDISKMRAARDGYPRGVRFIVDLNQTISTQMQYIESRPVVVYNLNPPYPDTYAVNPNPPRVEFLYEPLAAGTISTNTRRCTIHGLTADQAQSIILDAPSKAQRLWMPVLGTNHTIIGATQAASGGSVSVTVTLDTYPDQQLGGATHYMTYHFGIYGSPRPLLGEPTVQLPVDTAVDMNLSRPAGALGRDYDIIFTPAGHLSYSSSVPASGQVFLWVRNQTLPFDYTNYLTNPNVMTVSGEMMIVGIKSSGATTVQPVDYGVVGDPWFLAKQAVANQ